MIPYEGITMSLPIERDNLTYAILESKDRTEVADSVAESFTDGTEPTALALGIGREDFKQLVEIFMQKFLHDRLSIVTRNAETGEIAGAVLNEEMGPDLPAELFQFDWLAPGLALAQEMYGQYFQAGLPEAHEAVHIVMIAVSRMHRRKGIGHQLMKLSLEQARARGYRRGVVEASGLISQHIMRKAGFTDRVVIPYATFEFDGKRPFQNTGGHPSIIMMDTEL